MEFFLDNATVLLAKDIEQRLPVASLTKLMTALVVLENHRLDESVVISKEAMAQVGEQGNLKIGEVLSVENLLHSMLMESSNRAAYALAELTGVEQFINVMNQRAQELGLRNTHFADVTGLDAGSFSSVHDVALLSRHVANNFPLFLAIAGKKEYDLYVNGALHHKLTNTNQLLGYHGIIAGKTGYTTDAKGCMMTLEKLTSGTWRIHVVLGADDRFGEMQKLINNL
jgi:D-alanyl-D-alanine carboxypeptidase